MTAVDWRVKKTMYCNNQNHWSDIIIYGECQGVCGLNARNMRRERIFEKKMKEVETELEHDCHAGPEDGCRHCRVQL
jgi:hypothetical protein